MLFHRFRESCMALSFDQFVSHLTDSGLITAEDITSFVSSLAEDCRPKDGEQLARELVKQKKLTKFQAEQLYSGKGKSLVLGNYTILDKLGQGGMGMVLKAEHKRLKRPVAIKVMSPAALKTPDALKRFHREVEAAAKLRHTNVVATDDADEAKGTHFLVMEYVEGTDLSALVKKNGPLSVEQAVQCIIQAARGLEYAHEQGVVHRDIKPANLLLDAKGTVKILDMGLARIEGDSAGRAELTSTGAVMGTVDYMAPEQALSTKTADARSDIYSLGISLWYLLAGKCAYDGDTLMAKLLAHRDAPIPSLCALRAEVPPSVDAVFQKMVAKQAKDRYQSMTDVIRDLTACQSGSASTSATSPAASNMPEDTNLMSFLSNLNGPSTSVTATRPIHPTATDAAVDKAAEATMLTANAAQATDPQTMTSVGSQARQKKRRSSNPVSSPTWWQDRRVQIGGGVTAFLLLLLGMLVISRDKDGNEVAGAKEPKGESVESKSEISNRKSQTSNPKSWISNLESAAPPPAKAPFDAQQARAHQEAWARHLGTKVETVNSVGQKMILIPPGEFLMGSSDEQITSIKDAELAPSVRSTGDSKQRLNLLSTEQPRHRVVLSKPFRMSATEVTVGQFKKFAAAVGYQSDAEKTAEKYDYTNPGQTVADDSPAAFITWEDTQAYCRWLSAQERATYRLPTEAEWEYACRAGTTTHFSHGDDFNELKKHAWFQTGRSNPVAMRLANPFGLFDMHGNLVEWCRDYWDPRWYGQSITVDPTGPESGTERVVRGGNWLNPALSCRSATRFSFPPGSKHRHYGFRVVREFDTLAKTATATSPVVTPLPITKRLDPAPSSARAPFDAQQARTHQDAWARHLGVPVETTNSVGAKMILIPPGEFMMGTSDEQYASAIQVAERLKIIRGVKTDRIATAEQPQHRVVLTKPFLLSATEVTTGQFKKFVAATSYKTEAEKKNSPETYLNPGCHVTDQHPAMQIAWNDAVAYCQWLGDQEKAVYRLPTEAEWEYACRAGTAAHYSFGDDESLLDQHAWFHNNAAGKMHPVSTKLPNAFGLFDMHGNVLEWCSDLYSDQWYQTSPGVDPRGPGNGADFAYRGGSCGANETNCRAASRGFNRKHYPHMNFGFRVACEINAPANVEIQKLEEPAPKPTTPPSP
jgi:formylglycine-generating enzyme required for sulfatase activity/predicted Ser/Thr protein kinase